MHGIQLIPITPMVNLMFHTGKDQGVRLEEAEGWGGGVVGARAHKRACVRGLGWCGGHGF